MLDEGEFLSPYGLRSVSRRHAEHPYVLQVDGRELGRVDYEPAESLSGLFGGFGGVERMQRDPHWRDLIAFHEYFHGDDGAGLGASHQTGWTALVAKLVQQSGVPAP